MSFLDFEESLESFFDMMEKYEKPSTPTDSEEAESSDDTASTSEAVDPDNRAVFVDLSAEADRTATIGRDPSGSACVISDSEAPRLGTPDSSDYAFSWMQPRPGIRGYLDEIPFFMQRARNVGYLLPFEFLCLICTIPWCSAGGIYWRMCPANEYIPRYVFIGGLIFAFSLCVQIMDSAWKFFLRRFNETYWRYFCAFGIGWVGVIITLIEMIEFYTMSYSFESYEDNYCDETFYWFVYYKNIAFGVLMSLAALIYIPSFNFKYYYRFV